MALATFGLLCAGTLADLGAAAPKPGHKVKACLTGYTEVAYLGTACRVAHGNWKIRLRDGDEVETHGVDPLEAAADAAVPVDPRHPVCATQNPQGDFRFVAIVAWPTGAAPTETDISFRNRIHVTDGRLYSDAMLSGTANGADYVYACDSVGQVRVDRVELAVNASQATFRAIVDALKARGYDKPNEKYVVWYDNRTASMPCGTGTLAEDESDSALNPNNIGPDWGVSFKCDALQHEQGHNVGAVQYNSPFSTGDGAHCWEERDIMCYADGGNRYPGALVTNCPDRDHFDCHANDYFDARIGAGEGGGPGSYLDVSWNIGECYDRWIVNYRCPATPGFHREASATCASGPARVTAGSPVMYGRDPAAAQYVAWHLKLFRWTGTVWEAGGTGPWYVGVATAAGPAEGWWDLSAGAYAGGPEAASQTLGVTSSGQWLPVVEFAWFTGAGQLVSSDAVAPLTTGPNASGGSPLCSY